MKPWLHHVSLWLKSWPRAFDSARKIARHMGYRPDVYKFLSRLADRLPEVVFVQAGANDGMSTDPIREFVIPHAGWKGVLIEPLPGLFQKLRRSYSRIAARPGLEFLQAAVSDVAKTEVIWKIRDDRYHHYPVSARGMASFNKSVLTKHFPEQAQTIESDLEMVEVPCLTYSEIIARFALTRVDLFVMDVEGHEPNILRSTPLTGPLAPRVVLYELDHISPVDQARLLTRFREHGYHFRQLGQDGAAVCDELRELVLY